MHNPEKITHYEEPMGRYMHVTHMVKILLLSC
jgi:hypothetical protein